MSHSLAAPGRRGCFVFEHHLLIIRQLAPYFTLLAEFCILRLQLLTNYSLMRRQLIIILLWVLFLVYSFTIVAQSAHP